MKRTLSHSNWACARAGERARGAGRSDINDPLPLLLQRLLNVVPTILSSKLLQTVRMVNRDLELLKILKGRAFKKLPSLTVGTLYYIHG